jgi:hypothetical protein
LKITGIMTDPRLPRIREAVAAENEAWDRATERRADAEFALEQYEESPEFDDASAQYQSLSRAVEKARQEERDAERVWRAALERAQREII